MKQKHGLLILFVIILLFSSCGLPESMYSNVVIERLDFADKLGNDNGIATEEELEVVDSFFQSNSKAYFLGGSFSSYEEPLNIETVQSNFIITSSLYGSEDDLRNAFEGIGIRTPLVGVYIVEYDSEITITHIYRAPGPNVSDGKWERVEVE